MAEPALAYPSTPRSCPAIDSILAQDEYSLPETDGLPLADGRVQQIPLTYSRDALRYHLRHLHDNVAVEGDMFIYYIGEDANGSPKLASVSPDIFIVFGVADRPDRNSYVLWNEPDADIRFVLELASPSTRRRDHTVKRDVYASLGVAEYFLYDPPGPRHEPNVIGLRLRDGHYEDMPCEVLPNGSTGVRSETIGLIAYANPEGDLRWFDPVAGQDLHSYEESLAQLREAENQRDAANARLAELETRLRRSGGEV